MGGNVDLRTEDQKSPSMGSNTDIKTSKKRLNTPLRRQYLAEVEVIQKKYGDLEDIRQELGLSRRKMCQLLLVDPSAWTRWQQNQSAPPSIYRSLQWYLTLIDKKPEWHPMNSFNSLLTENLSTKQRLGALEDKVNSVVEPFSDNPSSENVEDIPTQKIPEKNPENGLMVRITGEFLLGIFVGFLLAFFVL
tara:strand:- start:27582 stop:28154 length:573 start_codon:yes stop_codon:yes gene_type:complete